MTRREQDLLSAASITTFKLNGQFLALAEELARPAGLTAAWWQVLGAVLVPTEAGRAAIGRIGPAHAAAAARLAAALGEEELAGAVARLRALSAALDDVQHGA